MNDPATEELWYLLEQQQPFSQSVLWKMQRAYFAERGAEAWRQGEVPHYVTSNPTIAQNYADVVFAFLQDRQRLQANDQAQVICELGAGSGRFAFHFLLRLTDLCAQNDVDVSAFRYILTDFTQSNLDAWHGHPRFQAWFESGLLDMALFDVNHTDQLSLQHSGEVLSTGTLRNPLVVLANYVFDGVPQDLFYFKDQIAHDCLISLTTPHDPETLDVASLLERIHIHYDYRPLTQSPYQEPVLQALLEQYRHDVNEAHAFIPATGLRCLTRLKSLSQTGLLLLSADKGNHGLPQISHAAPPGLEHHGSFSLSVNYHAFQAWCEAEGGVALLPESRHQNIAVVALLLLERPLEYAATCRAYRLHVAGFGPDDFYTLARLFYRQLHSMQIAEILAYMRFNRADAHQLAKLMPRLMELAPELTPNDIVELKQIIDRTWNAYFPLGEERDLAFDIGCLLYELNDYPAALRYFERTEHIYGRHIGTLFNMAACHEQLGQFDLARPLLQKVLHFSPDNDAARQMINSLPVDDLVKWQGYATGDKQCP